MKESIRLLSEAASKIKMLRRENELMRARLEMFDAMMQLLYTRPALSGGGLEPDLVHEIEKFVSIAQEHEKQSNQLSPESNGTN